MNSRMQALLIVLCVWAVVYLPALGSLAFRPCHHFLVEFLDSEEIRVVDLGSGLDFSRARHARKGSHSSRIFLRHRAGYSLADQELAAAVAPGAFCRARNHARDFWSLGRSICQDHNDAAGDAQMVNSIQRTAQWHQLPV